MVLTVYGRYHFFLCNRWKHITKKLLVFWIFPLSLICIFIFIVQQHLMKKYRHLSTMNHGECCKPGHLSDKCALSECLSRCLNSTASVTKPENSTTKSLQFEENAFFIETSGIGTLNFRQACAVESLAFHNPKLGVTVLFVGGYTNFNKAHVQKLKERYSNIHFTNINLDNYVAGSPLEYWYYCKNWRNGPFNISHLSDGLRFLTLAKFGGYYFDLDVIAVQSVTSLRNFIVAEDDDYLGSSVIHAELTNPIMQLATIDFVTNYRSDIGGHNGPALLIRIMKNWCNTSNLESMDYVNCRGFSVLHYSSFYPVHCSSAEELFEQQISNEKFKTTKPSWLTNNTFGVHTWNQLTYKKSVYKNSTQDYRWLAEVHCPFTFSIAPEIF